MAKKQLVRLTESDLHRVIKESVNQILNERVDEGPMDFMKSVFGQGKNKTQNYVNDKVGKINNSMTNAKNAVQGAYNNAKQSVQGAYNNAKQSVQDTYGNMKQGAQTMYRNAQQDSRQANIQKSFQQFQSELEQYAANGGFEGNKIPPQIKGTLTQLNKMINGFTKSY